MKKFKSSLRHIFLLAVLCLLGNAYPPKNACLLMTSPMNQFQRSSIAQVYFSSIKKDSLNFEHEDEEDREFKRELQMIAFYDKYKASFVKRILPHVKHGGELVIIMTETGGNPISNNLSGFRGKNGYYSYSSVDEWSKHFRDKMDNKYSRNTNQSITEWLKKIAPVYNPHHTEEWLSRCEKWVRIFNL